MARFLALLAVLVVVGIGPHAHGAAMSDGSAPVACGDTGQGDDGDGALAGSHCGLCHVLRGVVTLSEAVRGPILPATRVIVVAGAVPPGLLAPDVPSPPPRLSRIA